MLFALSADQGESEPASLDSAGLQALSDRLNAAYSDGPGAELGAALKSIIETSDAATLQRVQDNVFRYWPALVDRLQAQMNADYVEVENLPEALRSRYLSDNGQWRVDILPRKDVRDPSALSQFVTDVEALVPDLTGGAHQSQNAGRIISQSMLQATGIALGIVAIFIWLLSQQIRIVLLVIFPLALAAILTAATGVLLDRPFNYANVIVLPLLIGIGVDSGIHLVLRHDQVCCWRRRFRHVDAAWRSLLRTNDGRILREFDAIAASGYGQHGRTPLHRDCLHPDLHARGVASLLQFV